MISWKYTNTCKMPNHVTNHLTVKGDSSHLQAIFPPGKPFSFSHTLPEPVLKETSWYEWRLTHWGTKWDAYDVEKTPEGGSENKEKENETNVTFRTAWTPPTKWVEHIAQTFPEVSMQLIWSDEDYPSSGQILSQDGKVVTTMHGYSSKIEDLTRAIDFMEKSFPDVYETHQGFNMATRLENLIGFKVTPTDWFYPESVTIHFKKDSNDIPDIPDINDIHDIHDILEKTRQFLHQSGFSDCVVKHDFT